MLVSFLSLLDPQFIHLNKLMFVQTLLKDILMEIPKDKTPNTNVRQSLGEMCLCEIFPFDGIVKQ